MSVLNLPVPPNWANAGKIPWWMKLCGIGGLAYLVVRGVIAAIRGSYLTAVLVFGFIMFPVLMLVGLLLASVGKVRSRTYSDATGFTVLPDRRFTVLIVTGFVLSAPAATVLAFLVPRGVIDIPMSRGMQVFSPVLLAIGAMLAAGGVAAIARRGGLGQLKFTPALIEYADVLRIRTFEWNDILDVTDHASTKDGKKAGRSVVLRLKDGTEQVIGGLNLYVPSGVAIYWLVRHYWLHPEHRMELTDHRAAERLRDGRFDVSPTATGHGS